MEAWKFPSKAELRLAKIGTSAQIAALGPAKLYIADRGGSRYQVEHLHHQTDPEAWCHDGHKTFLVGTRPKDVVAREAKAWANAKYGAIVWVRDPFGGYQDVRCVECARRAVAGAMAAKTVVICG